MKNRVELRWVRERAAHWDAAKVHIIGEAPTGVFDSRYRALTPGALVPGEWWRVEDDEGGKPRTLGYGWLDTVWGDAEIVLATDRAHRGAGVGAFILEQLDREARARGLGYLYNIVRPTHPERAQVTAWLEKHGFRGAEDGRLLRRVG